MNNDRKKDRAIDSTAYAMGNYGTVNKLFEEERFHASQGHGFAAERANDHIDRCTGHFTKIMGDDNAKNGPDRWVNGSYIQTKYYSTARGSVNAGFENGGSGTYRYMGRFGRPMKLEVPSDQYDEAVEIVKEKIIKGQVPGVHDPKRAATIVRKGNVSYEQSVRIAKAGTIESIVYDAASGVVTGLSAAGISCILTFVLGGINGEDYEETKEKAAANGVKNGTRSAATTVLAGQLSKAGLSSALVPGSEALAHAMGPEASAAVINAFRSGANIYGAAAMKSCAKLIRGNLVTGIAAVGVLSAVDAAKLAKGQLTKKQFLNKTACNVVTVTAGSAGFIAGQAIIPIPIVGGLIGSFIAGAAAGNIVNSVTGSLKKKEVEDYVWVRNT